MKVITDVFPLRDKQAPAGKYLGLGDDTIYQALEPAHWFLERQVPGTPNASDTDKEYLVVTWLKQSTQYTTTHLLMSMNTR